MQKLFLVVLIFCTGFSANAQNDDNAGLIKSFSINELKSFYSSGDSVYVINFWATFCKPCLEEIPYMQTISKKYETNKVKLLLVSLDVPSLFPSKLGEFVTKNKMTASIAWLNESNADKFCPLIDPSWTGAIPATLIYNSKTGYRKFTEEEYKADDFEKELKKAIFGD